MRDMFKRLNHYAILMGVKMSGRWKVKKKTKGKGKKT